MNEKKKEPHLPLWKDKEVPPVKGAVTDLQDITRQPAAIFGPTHPLEPLDKANPAVFDQLM